MLEIVSNESLRILAGRTLTSENWFHLVEARRRRLKPHLPNMPLRALGDLEIIDDSPEGHRMQRSLRLGGMIEKAHESGRHSRGQYRYRREPAPLKAVEGPFSLRTLGVWPDDRAWCSAGNFKYDYDYKRKNEHSTGFRIRFWGLTQEAEWLKIECRVSYFEQDWYDDDDYSFYPEWRTEVLQLTTSSSTLEEICEFCGIAPQAIWRRLGAVVEHQHQHCRAELGAVERLAGDFELEERLVGIIPPDRSL